MKRYSFLLICMFCLVNLFSQNNNKLDMNNLTPEQIEMYKNILSNGSSNSMSPGQNIFKKDQNYYKVRTTYKDSTFISNYKVYKEIFGMYLFSNENLSFEPRINIATPTNYILGTYDEMIIDISGLYDVNFKLLVNTEGNIRIPNVGLIKVSGITIEEATRKIKSELGKYYQGIKSGQTNINVSLGNIRSIKVLVIGDAVQPGSYSLPSLATAFNAIYAAGGPTVSGSMRKVKVIRNAETIATFDIYSMLVDGIKIKNTTLQDGDIVRIDPYESRIYIKGAVKRAGLFECIKEENLQQAINFAGGYLESADRSKIRVFRYTEKGRTCLNFDINNLSDDKIQNGDSIYVPHLYELQKGYKVTISGAVRKPGEYQLTDNITIKDLIIQAQGFNEMAYTDSVEIIRAVKDINDLRMNENKSEVIKLAIPWDINSLSMSQNVTLENGDQVIVRYIPGYEDIRTVRVEGEINLPGSYNIINKTEKVSDIITRAGGFTKYANLKAAFLIRTENPDEILKKLNEITRPNTIKQLEKNQDNTIDYNLIKNSAGNSLENIASLDSLKNKMAGTKKLDKIFNNQNVVGLDLELIMANRNSKYDLKLETGDILYIPRELQTVKVIGKVLFPTIVRFDKNIGLKDYVIYSGGFSDSANKNNIFVIYSNGKVKGTKQYLFFRKYPEIEPGCQIVVPEKPLEIKNRATIGESVGMLTSVSSMLVIVYSILKP